MPDIQPQVHADAWPLGDAGRAAARTLADRLPRDPWVLASMEPKAQQTAAEIVAVGCALHSDARVGETRRPHEWHDDFAARAQRFVAGEQHRGWESRPSVIARFDAAVREALNRCGGSPLVIVSHGQAMTVWLHSVRAVDDPGRFWSSLAFPDAWMLCVEDVGENLVAPDAPGHL
jgi:broad specificity phosphatase PhoE